MCINISIFMNLMDITPDTRIAMIYQPLPDFLGFGGFLERGVKQLCQTEHFIPGEEQDGYGHYFYIDDGPTYYMEPKYHPATYFAIDMVVKPFWYLESVERYFKRLQNFDYTCVSSTATLAYCQARGLDVRLIGFAADPEYHKPYPRTCNGSRVATNRVTPPPMSNSINRLPRRVTVRPKFFWRISAARLAMF